MEEPVISKFSFFYYAKTIGVALIVIASWAILIWNARVKQETGEDLAFTVLLCAASAGLASLYLYNNFRKITVAAQNITVHNYLSRKVTVIGYSEIAEVNTYRLKREPDAYGYVPDQNFVIDLNNGKSIRFAFGDYSNYDELKAAIYKYKLGIGA